MEQRLWKSRTEMGNSAIMTVTQWNNNGKTDMAEHWNSDSGTEEQLW